MTLLLGSILFSFMRLLEILQGRKLFSLSFSGFASLPLFLFSFCFLLFAFLLFRTQSFWTEKGRIEKNLELALELEKEEKEAEKGKSRRGKERKNRKKT